jgi:DNA-binding MarR family transcriptional regulator
MQMDQHIEQELSPIVQKLMRSFTQFNKSSWHQRTVAGCKPSEIRVLFCIRGAMKPGASEIKVSEISKLLYVTSPTVTQLLKGLETQGLIERHVDPVDRRSVGVTLTEKGEKVTQQAMESVARSLQGLIEYLGEEDSNRLVELLSKVFRYFDQQETQAHRIQWNGDENA